MAALNDRRYSVNVCNRTKCISNKVYGFRRCFWTRPSHRVTRNNNIMVSIVACVVIYLTYIYIYILPNLTANPTAVTTGQLTLQVPA